MFIYGGHDIREGSMDSLWMLDLQKLNDLEKSDEYQDKKCMWHLMETSGKENPGKVSRHTSEVYLDKMYLFGGSKSSGEQN
jgi:hypothetical protein